MARSDNHGGQGLLREMPIDRLREKAMDLPQGLFGHTAARRKS